MEYIGKELLKGISKSNPFIVDGNVIGVPFNLDQVYYLFGKEIIPDKLGIYHLFYKDQLVYIGMSKSIRRRLIEHLRDKDMLFDDVLWFCSKRWKQDDTIEETLRIKYKMIEKHKPVKPNYAQ